MSRPSVVPDPRVALAEHALEEMGISGARVTTAGHADDLAAVTVPPERWEEAVRRGAELDRRLKALGFRYAALDLAPEPSSDA